MNHALQNEEPVELWHVELAPNDVRVVTLEQLDDAFQRGLVNERTRVFQEGMDEPALLGELLGLGEDEDEAQAEAPASAVTSRHHQETLVGLQAATPQYAPPPRSPPPQAAPKRSAPPPAASVWPPVVQATPAQRPAPVAQQAVSTVSRRPPPPPADSAWPPVVAARPSAAPQYPVVAPSVVPTALDLSDDLDFPQPKRRGKAVFFGATVLAVAAGVALTVTGKGTALLSSMTASAASPAPVVKAAAPIAPAKSHAYDPGNEPVKLKEAPPPLVITTRENEASLPAATAPAPAAAAVTKSAPSKAAPTRSAGGSKRAKGGGGGAPKSGGFKAGSGKSSIYDPLNGSL